MSSVVREKDEMETHTNISYRYTGNKDSTSQWSTDDTESLEK